jgi:hypothetical protein
VTLAVAIAEAVVVAGLALALAAIALGYLSGASSHPYAAYRRGVAILFAVARRGRNRRRPRGRA